MAKTRPTQKTPSKQSNQQASASVVGSMLRTRLRIILQQWKTLRDPLPVDEIRDPIPDNIGRYRVRDAQSPEELIRRISEFAGLVWQVKDGLINWLKSKPSIAIKVTDRIGNVIHGGGASKAAMTIEGIAKTSLPLMLCADLFNTHKHYTECDRSNYRPYIAGVEFDTANSGVLGIYHDGARKTGDMTVTNPVPVPVRFTIRSEKHGVDFGDAVSVIGKAFAEWVPIIRQMDLLSAGVPEDRAILDDLTIFEEQVKHVPQHRPGGEEINFDRLNVAELLLIREDPAAFMTAFKSSVKTPDVSV